MKLKDTRLSYLLQLVILSLTLLGLGTFHEIIEVNALGFSGTYPEGEYAMGSGAELRPDDDLLNSMLVDMYGRSPLFSDLSTRSDFFSYIITVDIIDGEPDVYTFLFAPVLARNRSGSRASYGYYTASTNRQQNIDFINDYGLTGLVYSSDGSFMYYVGSASASYDSWYANNPTSTDTPPMFGMYSTVDYSVGGPGGTYMIYTNIPHYDSSFILPAFSSGDFPDADGGESGFWASLIGFFTDIWNWLTGFWDNLTDWFTSILTILWDWLLSFIEFVLGLFIPTDAESWMDLIYNIRDSLMATTGTLGLMLNYMFSILGAIALAPVISELTIPGTFFGSQIVLNFDAIATNAPVAWSTMVLLIRGIFILNIWPPVIDFFFQILFKDYRSAVIDGMNLKNRDGD